MKSEPEVYSLDDLKHDPAGKTGWDSIRNYQARNFMRDQMQAGDLVLYYHSNAAVPGVYGVARIVSEAAIPDPTQFDPASRYYDPKSSPDDPRWVMAEVAYVAHFPEPVSLAQLKADPALADMLVIKRGQRLSIQPVAPADFRRVCELGGWTPPA